MARRTREQILERATDVLAKGEKPTVAQFAEAAGVSRASFYRAFESRGALLEALAVEPEPGTRQRILEAALTMVGAQGLTALSMDDLATQATVSRATLYRLFPGKAALFKSLVKAFSPLEPVTRLMSTMQDQPPDAVMPEIARTIFRTVYGSGETRVGMLRAMLFEVSSLSPDAEDTAREVMSTILGSVGAYVLARMESGHLRRMHPLLALQSFIGPIFFHLMTRPMFQRVLSFEFEGEAAVTELAEGWLRAMKPDSPIAPSGANEKESR